MHFRRVSFLPISTSSKRADILCISLVYKESLWSSPMTAFSHWVINLDKCGNFRQIFVRISPVSKARKWLIFLVVKLWKSSSTDWSDFWSYGERNWFSKDEVRSVWGLLMPSWFSLLSWTFWRESGMGGLGGFWLTWSRTKPGGRASLAPLRTSIASVFSDESNDGEPKTKPKSFISIFCLLFE